MSLIDEAMAEVRAGNVVLWQEMGGGVVLTESLMTNAKANLSSPAMNRLRDELASAREARGLEAEEREARDWRANVERWET